MPTIQIKIYAALSTKNKKRQIFRNSGFTSISLFVRQSIYVKMIASIIASITKKAPTFIPHSTLIANGTEKNKQNVVTSDAAPNACVPRILTFRLIA